MLKLPPWIIKQGWPKSSDQRIISFNSKTKRIKQRSDVWALSRSELIFLWNSQFELICHEIHFEPIASIYFGPNQSGKKIQNGIMNFCGSYFKFLPGNLVFWTYMESNAAVRLQFEDLRVSNYLFLKYMCIHW